MAVIWNVRLFAYLREGHGPNIEVEAGATAYEVLAALGAKGLPVEVCRLAVNQEFVIRDRALSPSDELALIPPVSGG